MPGCRGGHRMFQKHWYGKDPSEVKHIAAGDIQPWAQEHCQPAMVDGCCIGGVSKHQNTRPSLGLPQKGWTTRSLRSVAPHRVLTLYSGKECRVLTERGSISLVGLRHWCGEQNGAERSRPKLNRQNLVGFAHDPKHSSSSSTGRMREQGEKILP